jgi:hypothetical protein
MGRPERFFGAFPLSLGAVTARIGFMFLSATATATLRVALGAAGRAGSRLFRCGGGGVCG